jgi:hypothetical protein
MPRIKGNILKYLVSAVLVFIALGATALTVIFKLSNLIFIILLVLFISWCFGLVWFTHFRTQVSKVIRRGISATLIIIPVFYFFAWMNVWRLEQYLEHRNWKTYTSKHFIFHYASNYTRSGKIITFANSHDNVFEQNCNYLKVSLEDKIDFYIYDELEEGFAVPDWNMIMADDDQSLGHEMTHIIAYYIAGERQKIKLLDEGIAAWLKHSERVPDHHYAAWKYIHTNGLPSISELASTRNFHHQNPPAYFPAASFVGYLIDNYGVNAFRRLWTINASYPELYSSAEDLKLTQYFSFIPGQRGYFESAVLKVYIRSLNELDNEWRTWLNSKYKS